VKVVDEKGDGEPAEERGEEWHPVSDIQHAVVTTGVAEEVEGDSAVDREAAPHSDNVDRSDSLDALWRKTPPGVGTEHGDLVTGIGPAASLLEQVDLGAACLRMPMAAPVQREDAHRRLEVRRLPLRQFGENRPLRPAQSPQGPGNLAGSRE
jgi:hypothetical protein